MRADTETELIEEAKNMFFKLGNKLNNIEFPKAVELSYDYVLNNSSNFKYADHPTAGSLIRFLEKIGYLELIERTNSPKLVVTKQKGKDFLAR